MKRGMFRLLIAAAAIMSMTGTAFGANQIFLKTDVPPIPKTACYQAGTMTMEFDHDSRMNSGDRIVYTTQNGTELCRDINFFLVLVPGAGPNPRSLDTRSDLAVASSEVGDELLITGFDPNYDYGFQVIGNSGSQTITLTLGRRYTVTNDPLIQWGNFDTVNGVGAPLFSMQFNALVSDGTAIAPPFVQDNDVSSDRLVVRLFDRKAGIAGIGGIPEFWGDNPLASNNQYTVDINRGFTGNDNVLCLNTANYGGEFVEATPESIPVISGVNRLAFSGDYRIASVRQQLEFVVKGCKDFLPTIEIGLGQNFCGFDVEGGNFNRPREDFCPIPNPEFNENRFSTDRIFPANNIIVEADGGFFPSNASYTLILEILVNGEVGDNGVFFAMGDVAARGFQTRPPSCGLDQQNTAGWALPGIRRYYNPQGRRSDEQGFGNLAPAGVQCVIEDPDDKVVGIETWTNTMNLTLNPNNPDRFLVIDVPTLTYDQTVVQPGDVVSIRARIGQQPCSLGIDGVVDVAKFVEECFIPDSLIFPYFTSADGTFFDSAFVITNLGTQPGPVTLFWYEADGDSFKGTVQDEVPAQSVWNSGLLPQLIEDPGVTWEQIGGAGTVGDSMSYIVACTGFPSDGFAFIFGAPNGDSMGYIPRATATVANTPLPNVCR